MQEKETTNSSKPKVELFSPTRILAKAAGLFFIAVIFSDVANYVFRFEGTRLGPAEYGVFSLAYAIFDTFVQLSLLGVDQAVGRFLPEERALGRKDGASNVAWFALKAGLLSSAASLLIVLLGAPILSSFFHEPRLATSLYALAFAIPLAVICAMLVTIARASRHPEYEAAAKYFSESSARVIFGGLAVFLGLGAFGISLTVSIGAAVSCMVALYFVSRLIPGNWADGILNAEAPEGFFSFATPIYLSIIAGLVITYGALFAVGKLLSVVEVGILNAAIPIATLVQIPSIAVPILFGTVVVELRAKADRKAVERIYKNITKAIILFTLPLSIGLLIFSRQAIVVLFGSQYAAGADALAVLSFGYLVLAAGTTASALLLVEKRSKIFALVSFVSVVSFIIGLFTLIPLRAFFGAALANAIALSVQGVLPIAAVYYFSRIHPFSGTFWRTVASAALAGIVALYIQLSFPLQPWPMIILGGSAYVASYAIFLFVLRAFDADDLGLFKLLEARTGIKLGRTRALLKNYYFRNG